MNNKPRTFPYHQNTPCTRTHQIGALALIITTYFLTRLFDHSFSACNSTDTYSSSFSSNDPVRSSQQTHVSFTRDGRSMSWPERGYGSHLSLKIYVYDELEIDGLNALLRGRDGKISADACLKGQWGTQVIFVIEFMLLCLCFRLMLCLVAEKMVRKLIKLETLELNIVHYN